ncbi:MAG: aspartate aminotransferase family protein, partial [Gemmatimonadota bacterium]|nr:aspartate aminotransferase family protein [Gemmatimonadota bacterium]
TDYASARASDAGSYAKFFHAMLEGGVSPPPSAFETWFVSTAHGESEIQLTLDAARDALR